MKPAGLVKELSLLKGGKRLHGSIYLHMDTICAQKPDMVDWLKQAAECAGANPNFNMVKLHPEKLQVSFLYYPGFRSDAHPVLMHSTSVAYRKGIVVKKDYSRSANRPILHRKETFLAVTDPDFEKFQSLTKAEESAGLLAGAKNIGYERGWSKLLETRRCRIDDHELVCRE